MHGLKHTPSFCFVSVCEIAFVMWQLGLLDNYLFKLKLGDLRHRADKTCFEKIFLTMGQSCGNLQLKAKWLTYGDAINHLGRE